MIHANDKKLKHLDSFTEKVLEQNLEDTNVQNFPSRK